jgi:hypothetical protein
VIVKFPLVSQLAENLIAMPEPLRNHLRERVPPSLVIPRDMRRHGMADRGQHIIRPAVLREKHLDAGSGGFVGFYENKIILM